MSSFSISIRLQESVTLKSNKHPIVLQFIWKNPGEKRSQVRHKRIGFQALPEQWDEDRYRSSIRNGRRYNSQLDELEDKAWDIYDKHYKGRIFNYRQFAEIFDNEDAGMGIAAFAEIYKAELYGQDRAGTALYYRDVVRAVTKYVGGDISFEEIDEPWLRRFEAHQVTKGFKCNTYMRGIRALYNKAIERRYVDYKIMPFKSPLNPYGYNFSHLTKLKGKNQKSLRIKTLSEDEIQKIIGYVPSGPDKERAIDLWLFSYYNMGVNLKDIAILQSHHIRDGVWYYQREKTRIGIKGKPLIDEANHILEKYHNPENKYVFNFVLKDRYDKDEYAIKCRVRDVISNLRWRYIQISKEIGLDGYFTFYTARHSAASQAVRKGGNIKAVSQLLDHKSIQTTNNYVGNVDKDELSETLDLLRL